MNSNMTLEVSLVGEGGRGGGDSGGGDRGGQRGGLGQL